MSSSLTDDDLDKVYRATFDARIKWKNVLLALKLSSFTINSISMNCSNNPDDCYREGLSEWLRSGERSWKDMVEALSSPTVDYNNLARTIEKNHVQFTAGRSSPKPEEAVDQNRQKINDDLIIFLDQRLGGGAFGVVFKGSYTGKICAVKVLLHDATEMQTKIPMGKNEEASKAFEREREFLESLQHPNIVQYLSTAKHPTSGGTILVVELMDCDLRSYFHSLDEEFLTSECENSLMEDMACGLAYIHSKKIIHRDLCGDNVLLKLTQPVPIAKISDFGMSRQYDPSKLSRTLTAVVHRMGYLPIHVYKEIYDNSLDVFSLGVIMVQIVCKLETIKSAEDRSLHVAQIPHTHRLRKVIDSCLQEDMRRRPSARDIYASLTSDLDPVEATKRKSKDTKPVHSRSWMSVIFPWPVLVLVLLLLSVVFCLALLTAYSQHGVTPQNGLGYDSQALKYEDRGIAFLSPHELPESQPPSTETSHHWQVPNPACFLDEDKVVRCNQLQGKNMTYSYKDDTSGSMDEGPPPREFKPLPKWRRGKDMPIEMSTSVQSVVIGDTVYVGGGFADNVHEECTVMKLEQDQWIKLPEYTAKYFAMTSLSNRLVLVGGRDTRNNERTNQLAVFESGEWSHPYPLMNIARSSSTAVSFNNHIIVAGGYDDKKQILSSVEVLDVASGKWYSAQSLPNPRSILKSTIIGNTLYIMGGWDDKSGTKTVLHVDLNHLIASNLNTPTLWQKIEDTSLLYSTPLSIGRLLLAIGGQDEEGNPSSSIHLYQPDTKWVKVGDLPTARYFCTCSVLSNEEVIVAGGRDEHGFIDTVDFFLLH